MLFLVFLGMTTCSRKELSLTHPIVPDLFTQDSDSNDMYSETGIASWYGLDFHNKPTASGEPYDMYAMTAAHKTLPLGTWVRVTHLDTGQSILVRINDRGPFVKERIIDLSCGAAKDLGIYEKGTARVEIRCPFSESRLRNDLGYWVQLGAYRNRGEAEKLAGKLKDEFAGIRIITAGAIHRVRIGPFSVEQKAIQVCNSFRENGEEAFVIRDLLPIQPSLSEASGPENSPPVSER